jgi:hypothetical protein
MKRDDTDSARALRLLQTFEHGTHPIKKDRQIISAYLNPVVSPRKKIRYFQKAASWNKFHPNP